MGALNNLKNANPSTISDNAISAKFGFSPGGLIGLVKSALDGLRPVGSQGEYRSDIGTYELMYENGKKSSLDLLDYVPDPLLDLLLDQLRVLLELLKARLRVLFRLRLVLDARFEDKLEVFERYGLTYKNWLFLVYITRST